MAGATMQYGLVRTVPEPLEGFPVPMSLPRRTTGWKRALVVLM